MAGHKDHRDEEERVRRLAFMVQFFETGEFAKLVVLSFDRSDRIMVAVMPPGVWRAD